MKYIHQVFPTDLPDDDVLSRLFAVTVNLSATMAKSLSEQGLTVPRAEVVWRLHQAGPMTQRALSDALSVTPRNITGLVDALERGGYVSREPHPNDRRATLVTLTAAGAEAGAAMADGQATMANALFGDLSRSQTLLLARTLDRVLVLLRDTGDESPVAH